MAGETPLHSPGRFRPSKPPPPRPIRPPRPPPPETPSFGPPSPPGCPNRSSFCRNPPPVQTFVTANSGDPASSLLPHPFHLVVAHRLTRLMLVFLPQIDGSVRATLGRRHPPTLASDSATTRTPRPRRPRHYVRLELLHTVVSSVRPLTSWTRRNACAGPAPPRGLGFRRAAPPLFGRFIPSR